MYDIELHIKARDWLYIQLIGVVFATLLAAFGYRLIKLEWLDGAEFGALLGLAITLLSLLFITTMNQYVLPFVNRRYWLSIAIFFSFLSGFMGTWVTVAMSNWLDLVLILQFRTEPWFMASAIGVLTYIVGALLYRFVRMRNEKEQIDQLLLESRLRSLETQLNPHFLFNSLNSVAELIHQNPDRAEMAILKISTFLRQTMDEQSLIPLGEELRNAGAYVELENIRFDGKIRYHEEVTTQARRWQIPKFSIQLLVENAIKHGYDPVRGELDIRISIDGNRIIVTNNGTPITRDHAGIGLRNLRERLKYLCKGTLETIASDPPTFAIDLGECYENFDRG